MAETSKAELAQGKRCFGGDSPLYQRYHDEEWGVPVHDDRVLFEFLILEGAQAGLSWSTILNKRENYRRPSRTSIPNGWRGSRRSAWRSSWPIRASSGTGSRWRVR